jgi:hypothetical protein
LANVAAFGRVNLARRFRAHLFDSCTLARRNWGFAGALRKSTYSKFVGATKCDVGNSHRNSEPKKEAHLEEAFFTSHFRSVGTRVGATPRLTERMKMLNYGEAYLELNDKALERLAAGLSPAAVILARLIAAEEDHEEDAEDELEAEAA